MFEQWKKNREDKKRARQAERCEAGDHHWILFSEMTSVPEHDLSRPLPPHSTTRVYKCAWCGKERTEVFGAGDYPRDPMSSAQYNSF